MNASDAAIVIVSYAEVAVLSTLKEKSCGRLALEDTIKRIAEH
jgi:hypothetical protein